MKKILMFVMCSILAVSYAYADDVAQLKAACQSSNKTLWVERNKVCIPRNPCESSDQNILKYCNRTFADVEIKGGTDLYIDLINMYATTHVLDCHAVAQRAKLLGQDYVVCQGTDVMVFEFDDINDRQIWEHWDDWTPWFVKALCAAGRGTFNNDTCKLSPESICIMSENILQKNPSIKNLVISTQNGDNCEFKIDREAIKAIDDFSRTVGEGQRGVMGYDSSLGF